LEEYCRTVHIVLVGTSSLRNFLRALRSCVERGACDDLEIGRGEAERLLAEGAECWKAVQGLPGSQEGSCRGFLDENPLREALREYVVSKPRDASAELNAMGPLLESRCSGVERVILVATDTLLGRLAAEALKDSLLRLCPGLARGGVEVAVVNGLGIAERMWEGLNNLMRTIMDVSSKAKAEGLSIAVNLTGGFKPEAGYALLASLPHTHIAYYIHESFRRVVVLPLLYPADVKVLLESGAVKRESDRIVIDPAAAEKAKESSGRKLCGIACTISQVDPDVLEVEGRCSKIVIKDPNFYSMLTGLSALA